MAAVLRPLRRLRHRPAGRLHPPLGGTSGARDGGAAFRGAGRPGAGRLCRRSVCHDLHGKPRAAAPCSRMSMARSTRPAPQWVKPLPLCRWRVTDFRRRSGAMTLARLGFPLAAAAAAPARRRDGPWPDHPSAGHVPPAPPPRCDGRLAVSGFRARLSQSAGAGGRLRQERRSARRHAGAGLRLHRNRHGDAAAASSAIRGRACSGWRRTWPSSTAWASTTRATRRRCGGLRRARAGPASSASTSAPTRTSDDRIGDYVTGIHGFSHLASYFTVNISSPNTPGLRALQSRAELQALLARLNEARGRRPRSRRCC